MPSTTCVRASADVLVGRLAGERTRQRAHHQHQAGRAQRLGLVDGAAIVLQRRAQARRHRRPGRSRRGSSPTARCRHRLICRATSASPAARTWSRQGPMPRMPRRAQASMMAGSCSCLLTVAVLIDRCATPAEKSRIRRSRARPARAPCAGGPYPDRAAARRGRRAGTARPGAAASARSAGRRP